MSNMDLMKGAVGSLIGKLGKLLEEEYKLQNDGVSKKIGSLRKELECAHATLRMVAEVPPDQLDEQVMIWAREIREASYDMEDVLDAFLVSAQYDHEYKDHEGLFERLKKMMIGVYDMVVSGPFKRRKIDVTIDDINKRLEELTKRHQRYTVNSIVFKPLPKSTVDPRLAAMYTEVTQLVGIDQSSTELIRILWPLGDNNETKKKMKMVSVVGVGGLGKTTLVKVVYDKLKVDFKCRAFVPVGRNPDLKKVLRDILIGLNKKKYMNSDITILDERQLINEIREYLESKRYFILVDDIWETKSWETIKLAFVQNNSGSRLITTTRKMEVAKEVGDVYELKPLPFHKSKMLFYMRIFGGEGRCLDNQLDKVSNKILKKCDGVPLAIVSMASLLENKPIERWLEVCNSIGFRDTIQILSLSYYDLPPHLKTCLLYLSAFPEDHVVAKVSLIWKWVGEGFVQKEGSIEVFEVGEGYFMELINRGMIQAVQSEESGLICGCRVHDMVLDLIRLISQEENFITISKNDEDIVLPGSRVRRIAHQNRTLDSTHHHTGMGRLRSLITSSCCYKGISLSSFKHLRVLAFENCKLMTGCTPLEHLESLVHLRYLGLTRMNIRNLPEDIGALKFLQILDLKDTPIKELPSSVGQLTQLVCLRARGARTQNGVIEKLVSIEQLHIRGEMQQFVNGLDKLSELRVLKADICGFKITHQLAFVESIHSLHKIRHLDLDGIGRTPEMWGIGTLSQHIQHLILSRSYLNILPACISPMDLPNLTYLDLYLCPIESQHLQILGELPELRGLKLNTKAIARNVTKVTVASSATDCSFKKLRYCKLNYSMVQFVHNKDTTVSFTMWNGAADVTFGSNTRDDRVAPAVMPNLVEIFFYLRVQHMIDRNCSCDNLGLEYLPSLQKVKVLFMTENTDPDGRKKVRMHLRMQWKSIPTSQSWISATLQLVFITSCL
ncbi:hypothetical protein PR202_ga22777 [Eleusine coracana subsp. coracana]|uniref:Uncharacterized protein n=1 Tax=Eleusine coracana subsp. coracana TaxID=191504 RepID=A0AAV5D3F4_ELECO|nr:hypothetical protein PR202_ga22777 [Eleusine coracana subsp. coracana]